LSRRSGDMLHTLPQGSSVLYPLLGNPWRPFLWHSKGLLLTDYLPSKTTMSGQYYASLLLKLRDAIKEKCRGMPKQGVWQLHYSAPIHKSMIAQKAVRNCGFVQFDHPAYSPDLAPSDYFLFRNLKSHLRGVHYPDNEALKEAVKEWLEGQTEYFYFSGSNSLPEKCCNALNSVVIILKNKVLFVTIQLFFMVELQNSLNAPRMSDDAKCRKLSGFG